MSLPKFNITCLVKSKIGNDLFGNPVYGLPRTTKCAVVSLVKSRAATTVRTDSSGTRGHANEVISDSKILMSPKEKIELDDFVEVSGLTLKVAAIRQRFSVYGKLDHLEVDGTIE